MKFLYLLLALLHAGAGPAGASQLYDWRAVRVGSSSFNDIKKVLGEPSQEYGDQLLYENRHLDGGTASDQPLRLNTVVLNIGSKGVITSIFLFPEWGITDEQLRPIFGTGEKMSYQNFLSSMGEVKVGAGTRPNEKLHYVSLNAPCELFPQHRALAIYSQQDVVTGNYLVHLILFF